MSSPHRASPEGAGPPRWIHKHIAADGGAAHAEYLHTHTHTQDDDMLLCVSTHKLKCEQSYRSVGWRLSAGWTNHRPEQWSRRAGPASWNRDTDWTSEPEVSLPDGCYGRCRYQIWEMMSSRCSVRSPFSWTSWPETSCGCSPPLQRFLQHKYCWFWTCSDQYWTGSN